MPPSTRTLLLLRASPHTQKMLRCLTPALPAAGSRLLHQTHSLSAAAAAAATAESSPPPESGEEFVRKQSLLWRLLKSGVLLATGAAVVGVSYVSYGRLSSFSSSDYHDAAILSFFPARRTSRCRSPPLQGFVLGMGIIRVLGI